MSDLERQEGLFDRAAQVPRMNITAVQHNPSVILGRTVPTHKLDHSSRIRRGFQAEKAVCELLESYGRKCVKQTHRSHFDILVDGWRVELKTSAPTFDKFHRLRWLFNFHHSGKPIEGCDFFILRAEAFKSTDLPKHLLLPAPSPVKTIALTVETLAGSYAPRAEAFMHFLCGSFGCPEGQNLLSEARDGR